MKTHNDNSPDEEGREEGDDPAFDFWSDEGAKRFNEILDEGDAYTSAGVRLSEGFEAYSDGEQCEYVDPELYDPDEETLPPGEMDLIFENSYIM
jgi:hypothetical protein